MNKDKQIEKYKEMYLAKKSELKTTQAALVQLKRESLHLASKAIRYIEIKNHVQAIKDLLT